MKASVPIAGRLLSHLDSRLKGRAVLDLRVGPLYVAVRLSSGGIGLAHLLGQRGGPCRPLPGAGGLAGSPAQDMARWILSADTAEASVGLAVLNAAAAEAGGMYEREEGDVRDLVRIRSCDKVAMVGHFAPLLPWIRDTGARLDILELRPLPGTRPAEEAGAVLPQCNVALITATALANHTLEGLLELTESARDVILLGPSTPMVPEIFVGTPVTLLAGVEVLDGVAMLNIVSEGGSTRQFGSAVRKVCARVPDHRPTGPSYSC